MYSHVYFADHMMAMKIINQAHMRKGKIRSFTSYCGGLPSPAAANNPFAYKFRSVWCIAYLSYLNTWANMRRKNCIYALQFATSMPSNKYIITVLY